jgi:hypothetical protein
VITKWAQSAIAIQPFLIETGAAFVVAPSLPAQRVQVVGHPRGWQVATVRGGCVEYGAVYEECYDAERAAAGIALKLDVTLVCWGDPDGEIAAMWIDRVMGETETDAAQSRWML